MTSGPSPRRGAIVRMLASRPTVLITAALLALVGLVPQFLSRTLPDIAFLLYAAGRVLDGARLYVDLIEINPPLIVWLNMPVVAAARALGVSEIAAYRMAVTLLLAGSVAGCRWVLMRAPEGQDPVPRRLLLLLIVFALFVLPRLDWGEREHLMLALAMPYVLLTVPRLRGTSIGGPVPIAIGLAAGIGLAIKPHFGLLWLGREGLLLAWPSIRRRPTVEGAVIAALGAAYGVALLALTPEYLLVLREFGSGYHAFLQQSLLTTALFGVGAPIAIGALIVATVSRAVPTSRELRVSLVVGILAFFVIAVLQQKGWRYHFYPSFALGWILLTTLAMAPAPSPARGWQRAAQLVAAAAAVSVAVGALGGALAQAVRPLDPRYDAEPDAAALIPVLRARAEGRNVMALSVNMQSGFPLATYAGARWSSRLSNLWPLAAEYDSALWSPQAIEYRPDSLRTPLEQRVLAIVSEDLARSRPEIVIVPRPAPDRPESGIWRLDVLRFLRADRRFREAFAEYDSLGTRGGYVVYGRRAAGIPAATLSPAISAGSRSGRWGPGLITVRILHASVFLCVLAVLLIHDRAVALAKGAADR